MIINDDIIQHLAKLYNATITKCEDGQGGFSINGQRVEFKNTVAEDLEEIFAQDIPPYRKKSKSKPSLKADHKHQYEDAIGQRYVNAVDFYYTPIRYCTVCGKITNRKREFMFLEPYENGLKRLLHSNEILEKYPDLKVIKMED